MFSYAVLCGLRNDLLTPAVRFIPCVTPLLGPSPAMESSDSCLGFTTPDPRERRAEMERYAIAHTVNNVSNQTCSDQSELVLLVPNFFFLYVSPREEKAHHSFEELVHELDGNRAEMGRMMSTGMKLNYRHHTYPHMLSKKNQAEKL
uniref:Uncharacterized protein n=1 Tax=Pygocentrus nattereri TaxID=42514 RepID=A0A3B4CRG9_PYGNA